MPEATTLKRAQRDKAKGEAASTQAGEFVREEIEHVREGKHGARSTKQAIAIGLSKARRAGVDLPPPAAGKTSSTTRRSAARDYAKGQDVATRAKPSPRRSRATLNALKKEGHAAATPAAMRRQGRSSASKRSARERSAAAQKAVRTKGPSERKAAARKAARTRAARSSSR
jgi:hypothetical protein